MTRVLILSADIGEGHATAARALAGDLRELGAEVTVCDDLRSLGRLQRLLLRDGSRVMFRRLRWLYGLAYWMLLRVAPVRALAARSLARFGARPLLRLVEAHAPDVVVSTYPGTTVVLGALRRRGRLAVPAVATVTDLAGLFFWAAPGVDLHLVAWPDSAEEVRRFAPGSVVRTVRPPTAPAFFAACSRADARARLGLASRRPVVAVSGGGWGVGDLAGAIRVALEASDTAEVVCLAGRDARVRAGLDAAFAAEARVRVLGFTDRMSELLAAADVLVHATGGVTCLEARLRGCPTIAYGFPIGHVRHNTRAMASLGLVREAATPTALRSALTEVLAAPRPAAVPADGAAAAAPLVLTVRAAPALVAAPLTWRRRALSAAAALTLTALLTSTGVGYSLAARGLDLDPLRHVSTARAEVALVVAAPRASAGRLAGELRRSAAGASLAVDARGARVRLRGTPGVDALPALPSGQLVHWLRTGSTLRRERRALGLHGPAPYLVPARRFTLGQYLLARRAGGRAVVPRVRVDDAADLRGATVRGGDVVGVEARDGGSPPVGAVTAIVSALRARGIEPVSVTTLEHDAGAS